MVTIHCSQYILEFEHLFLNFKLEPSFMTSAFSFSSPSTFSFQSSSLTTDSFTSSSSLSSSSSSSSGSYTTEKGKPRFTEWGHLVLSVSFPDGVQHFHFALDNETTDIKTHSMMFSCVLGPSELERCKNGATGGYPWRWSQHPFYLNCTGWLRNLNDLWITKAKPYFLRFPQVRTQAA